MRRSFPAAVEGQSHHGHAGAAGEDTEGQHGVHAAQIQQPSAHQRAEGSADAGRGGVDDEDGAGNDSADHVGDAEIAADDAEDRRRGADLGAHRRRHAVGDHGAGEELCRLSEAVFQQLRNGGDIILSSDVGNVAGEETIKLDPASSSEEGTSTKIDKGALAVYAKISKDNIDLVKQLV